MNRAICEICFLYLPVSFSVISIIFLLSCQVEAQESKQVKTGQALMDVKKNVLSHLKDEKKKSVGFCITRSQSSDDISKASEQLKGAGLTLVAIGEVVKQEATYRSRSFHFLWQILKKQGFKNWWCWFEGKRSGDIYIYISTVTYKRLFCTVFYFIWSEKQIFKQLRISLFIQFRQDKIQTR